MKVRQITPITHFIDPDEKVWLLAELNMTPAVASKDGRKYDPADWRGLRRYRIAWVNRGDALAEFQTLSPHPASTPPVRIPSLWEHTYAELCGIADHFATQGYEWEHQLALEKQGESALFPDLLDQMDRRDLMRRNISTFGPLARIQRDGFPTELARKARRRYSE